MYPLVSTDRQQHAGRQVGRLIDGLIGSQTSGRAGRQESRLKGSCGGRKVKWETVGRVGRQAAGRQVDELASGPAGRWMD